MQPGAFHYVPYTYVRKHVAKIVMDVASVLSTASSALGKWRSPLRTKGGG